MIILLHRYISFLLGDQVHCRPPKIHFLVLADCLIEAVLFEWQPVFLEEDSRAEFS